MKPFICFGLKERIYLNTVEMQTHGVTFDHFIHHSENISDYGFCGNELIKDEFPLLDKKGVNMKHYIYRIIY